MKTEYRAVKASWREELRHWDWIDYARAIVLVIAYTAAVLGSLALMVV